MPYNIPGGAFDVTVTMVYTIYISLAVPLILEATMVQVYVIPCLPGIYAKYTRECLINPRA